MEREVQEVRQEPWLREQVVQGAVPVAPQERLALPGQLEVHRQQHPAPEEPWAQQELRLEQEERRARWALQHRL